MIKRGFTLQELLISVAIIGVIAAIAMPSILTIFPDSAKAKYLKSYNELTTLTSEILDDSSLYYTTYNNDGSIACSGLDCQAQPLAAPYNTQTFSGQDKFPNIFASKLNLSVAAQTNNHITTFTTIDGVGWYIQTSEDGSMTINIDTDVSNGNIAANPVTFSANNTSPECFTFSVDGQGVITPTDALGRAYLENPTNTRNRQADINRATQLN